LTQWKNKIHFYNLHRIHRRSLILFWNDNYWDIILVIKFLHAPMVCFGRWAWREETALVDPGVISAMHTCIYYCHMWRTFVCFIVLVTCHCYTFGQHSAPTIGKILQCFVAFSIHVSLFWYCMDVRDWFQRVPWNSPIMRHLCFLLILEGLDAVPALLDTRMYTTVSKCCHVLPVLGKKNPWFDVLKMGKGWTIKIWYFQKTDFNLFRRASTWFCDSLSFQYCAYTI